MDLTPSIQCPAILCHLRPIDATGSVSKTRLSSIPVPTKHGPDASREWVGDVSLGAGRGYHVRCILSVITYPAGINARLLDGSFGGMGGYKTYVVHEKSQDLAPGNRTNTAFPIDQDTKIFGTFLGEPHHMYRIEWCQDVLRLVKPAVGSQACFPPLPHSQVIDGHRATPASTLPTRSHPLIRELGPAEAVPFKVAYNGIRCDEIASGRFGVVYRCDHPVGKVILKNITIPRFPCGISPPARSKILKQIREDIQTIKEADKPCIVTYIESWLDVARDTIKVVMKMETWTLESLLSGDCMGDLGSSSGVLNNAAALNLAHSMLAALDFLALKRIIHRDVKPSNILCSVDSSGDFTFKLAGLGVSNYIDLAQFGKRGIFQYRAPEFDFETTTNQDKVDVWSLFVTLMWVKNADGFRSEVSRMNPRQVERKVMKVANEAGGDDFLVKWREMGVVAPLSNRASAAQMLRKHNPGLIVSKKQTEIDQIPPLAPYVRQRDRGSDWEPSTDPSAVRGFSMTLAERRT